MTVTYLNKRWGDSSTNPTLEELRSALAELATNDPEHPDCWLSDELGWTVAAHQSGKIVFENVETGHGPWHFYPPSSDLVLTLWQALQKGDLDTVKRNAWIEGYGK